MTGPGAARRPDRRPRAWLGRIARLRWFGRLRWLAGIGRVGRLGPERGSGSILAIALIGATMTVTVLAVPILAVLGAGQSVQNAADAAALAAADTASGAVAGVPCAAAAEAAGLNGASVVSCTLDGLIASVTVAQSVVGFDLSSTARAGPPP